MPYTHWAYFSDEATAKACGAELSTRFDCLTAVDFIEAGTEDNRPWLLRAARTMAIDELVERHEEVEAVVERHGGFYDGGESGWFDPRTGRFA